MSETAVSSHLRRADWNLNISHESNASFVVCSWVTCGIEAERLVRCLPGPKKWASWTQFPDRIGQVHPITQRLGDDLPIGQASEYHFAACNLSFAPGFIVFHEDLQEVAGGEAKVLQGDRPISMGAVAVVELGVTPGTEWKVECCNGPDSW